MSVIIVVMGLAWMLYGVWYWFHPERMPGPPSMMPVRVRRFSAAFITLAGAFLAVVVVGSN